MPKDHSLIEELKTRPLFLLTSDQDWTPDWAAEIFLNATVRYHIPLHVFRTNPSPAFDNAAKAKKITQGWHPNFFEGSTQGKTSEEVIAYLKENFPDCTSARNHCFLEQTKLWFLLRDAGIQITSQWPTSYEPDLLPIRHPSGLVNLPVFFEDDFFFMNSSEALNLDPVIEALFSPGLKILNFHATFFALNCPNLAYYEKIRDEFFASTKNHSHFRFPNRGTQNVFEELVELVQAKGGKFESFEKVALALWAEKVAPSR